MPNTSVIASVQLLHDRNVDGGTGLYKGNARVKHETLKPNVERSIRIGIGVPRLVSIEVAVARVGRIEAGALYEEGVYVLP